MAHHVLRPPITEAQVRALRVNDTVTLEGTLYGIRDANQIALVDRGRATKFDLRGQAAIHTAPNVKRVAPSPENPAGYAPVCVGTTTSARMERFTRPMLERGLRLIVGKGGLGPGSSRAFAELGGAYLAIVGGTAALETTWVEAIEDVDMDDLHPESIWKFRVHGFGPLLVAMDSHGASLYDAVQRDSRGRRAQTLARLGVR
ncbi:MAG TPA: fumarate hydratase C-terminal domain-containing protein [Usitatibacter sp.]|nr:fumarate hydratase C-terminal domain-containing protein [Usitatibacter sp.]